MTINKYILSFPVTINSEVAVQDVINTFHDWIRNQDPSQILLDVADYSHVPDGPGVMLVGYHEISAFRLNAKNPVFNVTQKSELEGEDHQRLLKALENGSKYAKDFAKVFDDNLSLDTSTFFLGLNDRLPDRADAFAHIKSSLDKLNQSISLDWEIDKTRESEAKQLPQIGIKTKTPRSIDELHQHLSTALQAAVSIGQ